MGRKRYNQAAFGAADIALLTNYYMQRLCSIATSCFRWDGLPDTVDARFIEQRLLKNSFCLYFNDDMIGDIVTRCVIGGTLDLYDIPVKREAYANNGYRRNLTKENSVIIYDNLKHFSTMPFLEMFARKLANIDITMDININAQKFPVMILCDDKERLSFENIFLKFATGTPVIYGSKALDLDKIKTLDLKAPYLADKLQEQKMNILHEAFSFLGVGSMEIEKRERLIDREVQMSQEGNIAQRASRLKARQQAADKINNMFGTNISVEYDATAIKNDVDSLKGGFSNGFNFFNDFNSEDSLD